MFKMPSKYRRYNFQPRYYDERKEMLKRKLEREANISNTNSEREIKFQTKLAENWGNSNRKSQILNANIRLLVILMIIVTAVYYIFIGMDSAENTINNMMSK
jgi:hypothetical protein